MKKKMIDTPESHTFDFNVVGMLSADELETDAMPDAARIRRRFKLKGLNRLQLKKVAKVLPEIPAAGESWHIISDGGYDFWKFVPYLVGLIGRADEFYGSTWTIARQNVVELLELYDKGLIKRISMLTGLYFKRRESAVYATLLNGLMTRGQRYKAFKNHAKIILLKGWAGKTCRKNHITIEGSANFTANPRLEQFVITNDKLLYKFHRDWMEKIFNEG